MDKSPDCKDGCQYAADVGLREYHCATTCQHLRQDGAAPERKLSQTKQEQLAPHVEAVLRQELARAWEVIAEVHNWSLLGTMGYSASEMMASIAHIRRITKTRTLPAELNRNGIDHQIKEGADFWKWDDFGVWGEHIRKMMWALSLPPDFFSPEATTTGRLSCKVEAKSNVPKADVTTHILPITMPDPPQGVSFVHVLEEPVMARAGDQVVVNLMAYGKIVLPVLISCVITGVRHRGGETPHTELVSRPV